MGGGNDPERRPCDSRWIEAIYYTSLSRFLQAYFGKQTLLLYSFYQQIELEIKTFLSLVSKTKKIHLYIFQKVQALPY